MPLLVAGFVLVGASAAVWLLLTVQPTTLARCIRGVALGAIGFVGLLLALRGLAVLDLPLGGLIVYLLHHWSGRGFPGVARVQAWVKGRAPNPSASTVETLLLRMTLNQATGGLTGEVLSGQFAGARLDQLSPAQLRTLHNDISGVDEASARLLETYLDRTYPDWRESPGHQQARSGAMTREEALQVLGLSRDASAAQIKEAHRRLMTKLHPDQGGSDYLASQINAARDVLLKS